MSNTIPLPAIRRSTAFTQGWSADQMHTHAAAVSAADNAALRESLMSMYKQHGLDEGQIETLRERIKVLEDALRVYLDVYENVPDAIDRHGEWYQTEDAKLADTAARAALGDKT